jgi:C1A family cysteine protease
MSVTVPYAPDSHPTKLNDYPLTTRPSPLDPRDFLAALPTEVSLPPALTLAKYAAPFDQLPLGSCTANGDAGMYLTELLLAGRPPVIISRLALYYAERVIEGDVGQDNGAVPRDGLLTMQQSGVGREDLWPYDISKFTQSPPQAELDDAPNQKIAAFYRVSGLTGVKAALAGGHPVGIAMLVYRGMQASRNGIIPMPGVNEQPEGGHWLYAIGWQDDATWPGGGYLLLNNSWGATAGDGQGRYMLPYAYAGNTQLVSEFWYIELPAAPVPPPHPPPPPSPRRRRWHYWPI